MKIRAAEPAWCGPALTVALAAALAAPASGQTAGKALLHESAVEPGKAIEQFQQCIYGIGEVQLIRARNNSEKSRYLE